MSRFLRQFIYLHNQVWRLWACDGNVDADDDDVRDAGPYPDHERPGHGERQHRVDAQREEEEKRHLRGERKESVLN